jgi:hypothetical protein
VGAPNRQARKEEARRQREAVRRRITRRKRLRVVGAALAVVMVIGGITAYAMTRPDPAREAGCGSTQLIGAYPGNEDRVHVEREGGPSGMPALSTYPSQPPTSGPHLNRTLPAGVYENPPEIGQVIHSLEHGAVVIWFSPDAQSPELERIKNFYADLTEGDHVIVAPYDYPDQGEAGSLQAGQPIALVAWHRLQTCQQVSLDAVRAFVDRFRVPTGGPVPPGYPRTDGAPEAGSAI